MEPIKLDQPYTSDCPFCVARDALRLGIAFGGENELIENHTVYRCEGFCSNCGQKARLQQAICNRVGDRDQQIRDLISRFQSDIQERLAGFPDREPCANCSRPDGHLTYGFAILPYNAYKVWASYRCYSCGAYDISGTTGRGTPDIETVTDCRERVLSFVRERIARIEISRTPQAPSVQRSVSEFICEGISLPHFDCPLKLAVFRYEINGQIYAIGKIITFLIAGVSQISQVLLVTVHNTDVATHTSAKTAMRFLFERELPHSAAADEIYEQLKEWEKQGPNDVH